MKYLPLICISYEVRHFLEVFLGKNNHWLRLVERYRSKYFCKEWHPVHCWSQTLQRHKKNKTHKQSLTRVTDKIKNKFNSSHITFHTCVECSPPLCSLEHWSTKQWSSFREKQVKQKNRTSVSHNYFLKQKYTRSINTPTPLQSSIVLC